MSERNKKEPTPPPLLFMPAGGGLTLTPPDQPNVLMPVIQAEASLFGPEDEGLGEADSFVGQSPPSSHVPPMPGQSTSGLFHSTSTSDPFSQIDHSASSQAPIFQDPMRPPVQSTASPRPPVVTATVPPLAPTSTVPMGVPPMAAVTPMPNTSGLAGLYRKHGSSRYAAMPAGTYAGSPANLMSAPPAPVPFSKDFSEAAMLEPTSPPTHVEADLPTHQPPPPSMGPLPGMGYVPSATGIYIPVSYHWVYCQEVEGRDIWYPFSMADSISLEDAWKLGGGDAPVVSTGGGRYDVNVTERRRYAVYWEEDPIVVRRCSWFYKREGDNRYVPYDEDFSARLEDEYKSAVSTGVWHKRLEFSSGETIVMHNPNVMVHFQASSQPDEWGTLQTSRSGINLMQGDQMRPRVVKRGISDFQSIEEGESRQIDHLVFVVHGIGSICDVRLRSIVECVDDFRTISQTLLKSHFTQYVDSNRIGRVEFLPIHWHKALHSDATGIDRRLKAITLPSTQKLRHFVNDTLMDILFYTSPTYCQCIAETVGSEISRIYELFLSRNPGYNSGVSVAGHSLGSCILFDLLQHQIDPDVERSESPEPVMTNGVGEPDLATHSTTEVSANGDPSDVDDPTTLTLEDLLARVGLQDKHALFEREQIDMESLSLCSESDLKDLGLPLGPRKKLQGILKEELGRKDRQKVERERRVREEEDRKMRERLAAEMAAQQLAQQLQANKAQSDLSPHGSGSLTVDYLLGSAGTGQPQVKYPRLPFNPMCCFTFGSPVGLFLSARGVETMGEDFKLPTCKKYFNIFHPFDPVAYRLEPLITATASTVKPVLMPHHKGRKRLHLELKENLTKMGADIKHKIIASIKSTWNTINDFAKAHKSDMEARTLEQQVDSEMTTVVQQMVDDDRSDTASVASYTDEEVYMGQLNEGRRVDYVLQERPIESFNDYMFALTSHGCYWSSEDTVLLVMKEIYSLYGIQPTLPGLDGAQKSAFGPPPIAPPPTGAYYGAPPMSQPTMQQNLMSQNLMSPSAMSQPPMSQPASSPYTPTSVPGYNPTPHQLPPQTYNPGSGLLNMAPPPGRGATPPLQGSTPPLHQGRGSTPPLHQGRGSTPPLHQGRGSTPPSGLVYNIGPPQPQMGASIQPPPLAGFMKKL